MSTKTLPVFLDVTEMETNSSWSGGRVINVQTFRTFLFHFFAFAGPIYLQHVLEGFKELESRACLAFPGLKNAGTTI